MRAKNEQPTKGMKKTKIKKTTKKEEGGGRRRRKKKEEENKDEEEEEKAGFDNIPAAVAAGMTASHSSNSSRERKIVAFATLTRVCAAWRGIEHTIGSIHTCPYVVCGGVSGWMDGCMDDGWM
jgi:hypothetical protein